MNAFDERASRRGDVIDVPFVLAEALLSSEGIALGEGPVFEPAFGLSL